MIITIYLVHLIEVVILLMAGIHHQVVDIEFILHIELHKIQQFMHIGRILHIRLVMIVTADLIVQVKT